MYSDAYEDCLEREYIKTCDKYSGVLKSCTNYLQIIDTYARLIQRSQTVKEAREWADRMIEHALQVKE